MRFVFKRNDLVLLCLMATLATSLYAADVGTTVAYQGRLTGGGEVAGDSVAATLEGRSTARSATAAVSPAGLRRSDPIAAFMIELEDEPTVETYLRLLNRDAAPNMAEATQMAAASAKQQLARITQAQEALAARLGQPDVAATVIYRVQRVYNGVAAYVDPAKLEAVQKLPGVKAVHPLPLHERGNAYSVPFIKAPALWQALAGNAGDGVRIGIIDSGIDYLHRDFGGPGTGYATNNPTIVGDAPGFPGTKIVGGYDFCGDDYDATNLPQPDPDPMGSDDHGTHVAGTAAGFGVRLNGTTFPGPYDSTVPFSSLKIGPGVAPKALLYALKVFGRTGGTHLMSQAIEWAADPNGDGNFSDHLDVINMSNGTLYGEPSDPTVAASENAARLGMIVVAISHNFGDTFYITASPGTATRAISVANSIDDGYVFPAVRINSPPDIAGYYQAGTADFGPPLGGAGVSGKVVYAVPATACSPLTNGAAVKGNIALIDRGGCPFAAKVQNAQAAGAIGVLMVNSVDGPPVPMTAGGPTSITIPSMIITKSDGDRIKSKLPAATVNATLSTATVVRSEYADMVAAGSSRGPSRNGTALKPDICAPGTDIVSAAFGTGTEGKPLSGTSMAGPHVAGAMALLRKLHPAWSVEELKALVMNTATHDLFVGSSRTLPRYGPGRVGVGRIDLQNASRANAVAYVVEDPGVVSVSFGAPEVVGSYTRDKTVRVVNKGLSALSYNLSYLGITDVPGVNFSFPDGTALTVPSQGTRTFRVRLSATASLMKHTRDASLETTQSGEARHWLSEEGGYLTLTPTSGTALRLPLYAAPRPASAMSAVERYFALPLAAGTFDIHLAGTHVNTGAAFPSDERSLVFPYELAETSPNESASTGPLNAADLKQIGIRRYVNPGGGMANTDLLFGIATHADWQSPNNVRFIVFVDSNRDGQDDYKVYNADTGSIVRADSTDVYVTAVWDIRTSTGLWRYALNSYRASEINTVPMNTNVMMLEVAATDIGLTDSNTRFNYRVEAYARESSNRVDSSGLLTYDAAKPGFDFTLFAYYDLNANSIRTQYNRDNYTTNRSRGLLLLHHHNTSGSRDQVVLQAVTAARYWRAFQ
jgi:subtilisin family serine protease